MVNKSEAERLNFHLISEGGGGGAKKAPETQQGPSSVSQANVYDATEEEVARRSTGRTDQKGAIDSRQAEGKSLLSSAEAIEPNHRGERSDIELLSFNDNDPENPNHWSRPKKLYVVFVTVLLVLNPTVGSTVASGGIQEIAAEFHVTSDAALVLPTSLYLVGYSVGPILWGPASETYGRRIIMFAGFLGFTAFTLGCALSPNFASLCIFRLLCGMFGSCPIVLLGGICADVYHDTTARGRAMATFFGVTLSGPILGPLISGFVSVVSWRWSFWIALILAGVTWVTFIFQPETYAPIILLKRARKLRRSIRSGATALRLPSSCRRRRSLSW